METPRPSDPLELASAIRVARSRALSDAPIAGSERSEEAPSSRPDVRDPRAVRIVAKTIYRELRQSGLGHEQVMAVASELLGLVTDEIRARRSEPKP